ncbi:MAG TPA: AI-2E family transporter, partial [Noviherbaspirillum sp.]
MNERPASSFPQPASTSQASGTSASDPQAPAFQPRLREDSPFPHPAPVPVQEAFSDSQFFRRTLLVAVVTVLTGVLLTLVWFAGDIFLLLFGGMLFAVLLRAPTNWLSSHTRLSDGAALTISIVTIVGTLIGLLYIFAVPLAGQLGKLIETLPQAMVRLREWLGEYNWARPLEPVVAELARVRVDRLTLGRA